MSNVRQRLHPFSVVFFILRSVKDLIYPLLVFLFTTVFRDEPSSVGKWLWTGGGLIVAVVLLVAWGVFTWYRFTYQIEDGVLHVEHGLFVRKTIFISRDRIQSIDLTEGILHRLAGIAKLQVETAGGKKPEAILNAVSKAEAARIKSELKLLDQVNSGRATTAAEATVHADTSSAAYPVAAEQPKRKLSTGKLILFGATSGSIGVTMSLLLALYSQVHNWLKETAVFQMVMELFEKESLMWMIIVVLVAAWVLAVLGTVLKYAGFTISKNGNKLHIVRGLLERKQVTIPMSRIQAIRIVEDLLRRPFGLVTVHVVSAGYGMEKSQSTILFPLVAKSELAAFLQEYVPQFEWLDIGSTLTARSRKNYVIPRLIIGLLISIPVALRVPYGSYALLLPLLLVAHGLLLHRNAGWAVSDHQLLLRYGGLNITRLFVRKNRIQSCGYNQNPFQRLNGLATYRLSLASSAAGAAFSIRHQEEVQSRALVDWARKYQQKPPRIES